eukprot:285627-Prorocentrum_minimum.AAC.1
MLCVAAEGRNTIAAALWLLPWFVIKALQRASEAVQSKLSGSGALGGRDNAPLRSPSGGAREEGGAVAASPERKGWRWQVRRQG